MEQAREAAFTAFFRTAYKPLVQMAMVAGAASLEHAQDVVSESLQQLWVRWEHVENPRGWASRAIVSNLLKSRTREAERLGRTARGGHVVPEGAHDPGFVFWEDQQWVDQLLSKLPPAQREVMALLVEGGRPVDVARLLGKQPEAIRKHLQRACQRLRGLINEEREREGSDASAPTGRRGEAE